MSLIIYPLLLINLVRNLERRDLGFLAKKGFIDFAGSTVVHSTGGWVALALVLVIGLSA